MKKKTDKCEVCGKQVSVEELHELRDLNSETSYKNICEECEQGVKDDDLREPNATVFYDGDETPHPIGNYEDTTDGDFAVSWHRTDGWRGYYDVKPSDKWVAVHTDCILAYSEDAGELEKFDEEFKETLKAKGIRYARVFSRTSNLFSQGYDFFVEAGKEAEAQVIRIVLALKYRDPERFESTALTGADPKDQTKEDKLFVKVAKKLKAGMTEEEIIDLIQEEKK